MYYLSEILGFLQKKPVLGVIGGFGTTVMQYAEFSHAAFKVGGSALGLIVAGLTIYAKILEIKKHKKQ